METGMLRKIYPVKTVQMQATTMIESCQNSLEMLSSVMCLLYVQTEYVLNQLILIVHLRYSCQLLEIGHQRLLGKSKTLTAQ